MSLAPVDLGSSPRLRGTPGSAEHRQQQQRFIPAPAGNAWGRRVRSRSSPVHPRACGERSNEWEGEGACPGSSPRLRGTHA